jgi:hypothetical protein
MMQLWIAPRAGFWCRSASGWDSFRSAVAAVSEPHVRLPEPIPELLPAREGRRAPLFVRLALEAASQACQENDIARDAVRTVFSSAMGDIQITDYMCRTLAGPAPQLSPTKFHNSVHNAASGYWGIGAGNRRASTAISAQEHSFAAGLLETAMLARADCGPVLLVSYDVPAPHPLTAVSRNRQPFACALVLSARCEAAAWRSLQVDVTAESTTVTATVAPEWLATLAAQNSSAAGLPLLTALAVAGATTGQLGIGSDCRLRYQLGGRP